MDGHLPSRFALGHRRCHRLLGRAQDAHGHLGHLRGQVLALNTPLRVHRLGVVQHPPCQRPHFVQGLLLGAIEQRPEPPPILAPLRPARLDRLPRQRGRAAPAAGARAIRRARLGTSPTRRPLRAQAALSSRVGRGAEHVQRRLVEGRAERDAEDEGEEALPIILGTALLRNEPDLLPKAVVHLRL
eukprot:scaffold9828_cov105-Isochrysis_galbana.AAC.8